MKPFPHSLFSRGRTALPATALLGALTLTACFFGEEDKDDPDAVAQLKVSPCVDVPANVRAKTDSLVASGNQDMVGNFQFWFGESESWWDTKARNPQVALGKFEAALEAAPGHCQAVFGRAIASASLITQDKRMDDFVRKVEALEQAEGQPALAKASGFASIFKTSPDKAAPALAKLSASLEKVDPITVRDVQDLIEKSIMPRLDNTIASLEAIMDYSMFAVRFDVDGDIIEIDRGEIGPGLAGLKVAKAWLTVVAGYNLDINEDLESWARTLDGLSQDDFDHLTPVQTKALDQVTGLFKPGSNFTRMKPAWKERIQGIPALLLEAVGDAQRGLESVIAEARSGDPQTYDIWRAGSGEDADVDTADLHGVIDLLERSKKYLKGEVPVEYSRGTKTLRVDITRLFHVDGVQGLLPYFKFLPYAQWNDTVEADTSWGLWGGSREMTREVMAKLGYDPDLADMDYNLDWYIRMETKNPFIELGSQGEFRLILSYMKEDPEFGFMTREDTVLAELTGDGSLSCIHSYVRNLMVKRNPADPDGILVTENEAQGVMTLATCRVEEGQVEYVEYIDAWTRGPFEFTDAKGATTLTLRDFNHVEEPLDLKGKILFPDPTFNGIFPGQTNESVWQQVTDLGNSPGDRVERNCREVMTEEGWYDYICDSILPSNPSDLDYLVYYLDWMERID